MGGGGGGGSPPGRDHIYIYMGGCQIMVPFRIPITIRHLMFRVPRKRP